MQQQLTMPIISLSSNTSHLRKHYYGINGDAANGQESPTTILFCQFNAAQSLFEVVAARLADGKELMKDALTLPLWTSIQWPEC